MAVSHKKLWSAQKKGLDPFGEYKDLALFSTDLEKVLRGMVLGFGRSLKSERAFNSVEQVNRLIAEAAGRSFVKDLIDVSKPHLLVSYEEGSDLAFQKLQATGVVQEGVSRTMTEVQNALSGAVDRASVRLADGSGGTFRLRLRDLVADGISQGLSPRDLAKKIQAWAGKNNDPKRATASRAMMIARTESRKAQIDAEITSWRATGIVSKKEWLVSPQHCEFCAAAGRNKAIDISDAFYKVGTVLTGTKGGLMRLDYETIMGPPLHPNCRCTLLPVANRR